MQVRPRVQLTCLLSGAYRMLQQDLALTRLSSATDTIQAALLRITKALGVARGREEPYGRWEPICHVESP